MGASSESSEGPGEVSMQMCPASGQTKILLKAATEGRVRGSEEAKTGGPALLGFRPPASVRRRDTRHHPRSELQ